MLVCTLVQACYVSRTIYQSFTIPTASYPSAVIVANTYVFAHRGSVLYYADMQVAFPATSWLPGVHPSGFHTCACVGVGCYVHGKHNEYQFIYIIHTRYLDPVRFFA